MFILHTGLVMLLSITPPAHSETVRLSTTTLTATADAAIGGGEEQVVTVTSPVVGPLPSASAAQRNSVGGGSAQAALSTSGFIVTSHTDSNQGGAINSPDAFAQIERMAVQFDDTPAYRALFPAGATEIPIVVTFRLGMGVACRWQSSGDKCYAGVTALMIGTRTSSQSGSYTLTHDSGGAQLSRSGFMPTDFPPDTVLPHRDLAVPFNTFLQKGDSGNTPANTLILTMWVSGSTLTTPAATAATEISLELRNEPATFTLPDGRTLSELGVRYRFIPPSAQLIAPHDFDGNGKSDVFWHNGANGMTSVWLKFIGTFVTAATATVPDVHWAPVAFGDFDGDTHSDIFWYNAFTGETAIWFMNGSTVRSSERSLTVPPLWQVAASADFDHDGKADLFWRNSTTGETSVWLMNGSTPSATTRTTTVADTQWRPVAAGDFDGDGFGDVFWHNQSTGETSIWFMTGGAIRFAVRALTVSDVNWRVAGAADFNANGRTDLFWRNTITGETSVWRMNGAVVNATRTTTMSDVNWRPAVFGDYNGDSTGDIFWRNEATGETLIWYMDAGAPYSVVPHMPVADLNWHVH